MRRLLASAAFTAILAVPAAAQQAEVTADLNMRAGPGTNYPVISTIPDGRDVRVFGCVSDYDWCDVRYGNRRGWVFSDYLEYTYNNRRRPIQEWGARIDLPIVQFSFGSYADRHYRDEPWFRDRDRWDRDGRRDRGDWRDDDDERRGDRRDDDRRGDWRDDDRRGDWREDERRSDRRDDDSREDRSGDDIEQRWRRDRMDRM